MREVTSDDLWRRPDDVAYVLDGDRAVLLHLPTGRRTVLSDTATAAWLALVAAGRSGATAADLAPDLAARFAADPARVAADVRALLAELAAAQLVEPAGGGEPR